MSQAAPELIKKYRRLMRLWHWSHQNGLTLLWISVFNMIGWAVTVLTCH